MQVFPDRTAAEGLKTGRWFHRLLGKVFPRLLRPRKTLVAIAKPRAAWWHMGKHGDRPSMQVVADCLVTNVSFDPASVQTTHLERPHTVGDVFTKELDTQYSSRSWPIPPGASTEVRVSFWICPPVHAAGDDFVATVVLLDQYGNKHKVRKVRFKGDSARRTTRPAFAVEKLSAIADPVEKQVASVLKAEKERFMPGRDVSGQFGTVVLNRAGQSHGGFGTEFFDAYAPKPISIHVGSDVATVSSENADALLRLYEKSSEAERETLLMALRSRLAKDTEYEYVGYFTLFVLYRLGHIQEALVDARRYLKGGRFRGFQDALHLLDELLKYEHRRFSDADLDWIEAYAESLDVHTFRIEERIRDIRILRVKEAQPEAAG